MTTSTEPLEPLVALVQLLRQRGYRFTPATPATHARVVARAEHRAGTSLRDVLGYSRRFMRGLDAGLERLLDDAACLEDLGDGLARSRVRAATLTSSEGDDDIFLHAAWPTDARDAVFFGPDTLRFIALARRWLVEPADARPLGRLVDVGAGTGAGGLSLARHASEVVLTDINPVALRFARAHAAAMGIAADVVESDVLHGVDGDFDTIISNPPYLADPLARAYRDGGALGIALPLRILDEGLARLRPGGQLLLYTGAPVVEGENLFLEAARPALARCARVRVEELDPDVFGEELDGPAYADVERIALVGVHAVR